MKVDVGKLIGKITEAESAQANIMFSENSNKRDAES